MRGHGNFARFANRRPPFTGEAIAAIARPIMRQDIPVGRLHEDIGAIALAQRALNARVITASLAALTFLAALATLVLPSKPWMPPFLAATAVAMSVAHWLARQSRLGLAIALTTACVFVEHIGSVAISGKLGPVPYIAPVALLVVAATGTARWLTLAFVATLAALGIEGSLTPWLAEERASIVTAGLFAALFFVVALLHVRGVERAFAVAEKQARARDRVAKQALESEQRYRLIAESADDLIALVKRDGEIVYASPSHERVLGLPMPVLMTGRLNDHLNIHNLQDLAAHFEQAFVVGHGRTEMRIARADGVVRIFDVRMRRVEFESKELLAIISRDVSEKRELEDRLHASGRMEALGRLAGSVAHDFNNLLTVIQCSAEIGRERVPDGNPAREDLETVLQASNTAATLAEQLLTFSRRQIVERLPIEVGAVLREQRDILTRLVGPEVQLELNLAPGLPRVVMPKSHVTQLALNLAANARDAMLAGGRLKISTRLQHLSDRQVEDLVAGDYIELEVQDTGDGIPTDVISRVFEPLFSTKGGLGTGLGLATCQAIATQTGGAIAVKSVVGKGTTFSVYLPVAPDSRPPEPVQLPRGRDVRHVLLVDDDSNLRDLVTRMLRADGFEVKTAGTLGEARALLDNPSVMVDALISDIVLGNERGTDLLASCRKTRPNTGILLMSGYTPEAGSEQALVAHRASFLSKPFGRDQLLAALKRT